MNKRALKKFIFLQCQKELWMKTQDTNVYGEDT